MSLLLALLSLQAFAFFPKPSHPPGFRMNEVDNVKYNYGSLSYESIWDERIFEQIGCQVLTPETYRKEILL